MPQPSQSIRELFGRFPGRICAIVGSGPSLRHVRAAMLGAGPVIVLNRAIRAVEALGLATPVAVFSMQKDGCGVRTPHADCPGAVTRRPHRAALLVSRQESCECLPDYRPRYLFDAVADLGADAWWEFSANCAIRLARLMGCAALRLLSFDAATAGDCTADDGTRNPAYRAQAQRMPPLLQPGDFWIEPQAEGRVRGFFHDLAPCEPAA